MNNEITIIEISADYIYLIIVGNDKLIEQFVATLNSKNDNKEFIAVKINTPTATTCHDLSQKLNKNIVIDNGVEIAQCYTYAEGYDSKNYIIMVINNDVQNHTLSFPKMELNDDGDPEKTIFDWIKSHTVKIPKSIKKTLKPITLVGTNDEILVFSAMLT